MLHMTKWQIFKTSKDREKWSLIGLHTSPLLPDINPPLHVYLNNDYFLQFSFNLVQRRKNDLQLWSNKCTIWSAIVENHWHIGFCSFTFSVPVIVYLLNCNKSITFFPHFVHYTSMNLKLLKHWRGRRHNIAKWR